MELLESCIEEEMTTDKMLLRFHLLRNLIQCRMRLGYDAAAAHACRSALTILFSQCHTLKEVADRPPEWQLALVRTADTLSEFSMYATAILSKLQQTQKDSFLPVCISLMQQSQLVIDEAFGQFSLRSARHHLSLGDQLLRENEGKPNDNAAIAFQTTASIFRDHLSKDVVSEEALAYLRQSLARSLRSMVVALCPQLQTDHIPFDLPHASTLERLAGLLEEAVKVLQAETNENYFPLHAQCLGLATRVALMQNNYVLVCKRVLSTPHPSDFIMCCMRSFI